MPRRQPPKPLKVPNLTGCEKLRLMEYLLRVAEDEVALKQLWEQLQELNKDS